MSESTEDKEFKMTADEMDRIKTALKDKQFRDLLVEYANEISDPVNKKKYEDEIIAMEKERGNDVKLVKPQARFVVKTVRLSDNMKVFINIGTSPEVDECTLLNGSKNGTSGTHISLPHSLTPFREDLDKAGKPCVIYDVCFHPKTYDKAVDEARFRRLIIDTALDGLEKQGDVKFDRKNKKFPKMKYKGIPQPSIIRPTNYQNNNNAELATCTKSQVTSPKTKQIPTSSDLKGKYRQPNSGTSPLKKHVPNRATVPKYKVIHRGYFDLQNFTCSRENTSTLPKDLIVEIELPLAKSACGIDLDIFEKQLVLDSKIPLYHLDIRLPYKVNEDEGKAKFDKTKNILTVTLPVLKPEQPTHEVFQQPLVEEVSSPLTNGASPNSEHSIENILDEMKNSSADSDRSPCVLQNNFVELFETSHKEERYEEDSLKTLENSNNQLDMANVEEDGGNWRSAEEMIKLIDMENVEFDTSVLESLPGNSKLPPYCYDQTNEMIIVVVNVPSVRIEHLSLGFTTRQVCLSFPQNPDNQYSPDWNMVIRLDGNNFLNEDECGFEISEECLELNLKKHNDSFGLWDRIFIGVSEISLEVELFMTEKIAGEMLKKIETNEKNTENRDDRNEKERSKLDGLSGFSSTHSEDELSLKVDLMDLVDDVIDDSSLITPPTTDDQQVRKKYRFTTQRVYERSLSHDNFVHPRIKSILKRSKSDSGSYDDTDDDCTYSRMRSTTLSDDYLYSPPKTDYNRQRRKSVTFLEEPIVFEFKKLSKRQWKRQNKEEKQREAMIKKVQDMYQFNSKKSTESSSSSSADKTKEPETEKTKELENKEKHGKKWKKAERKRNRHNSESRSEEESEGTSDGKKKPRRKKKKNKKLNQNIQNGCYSSGPDSSGSERIVEVKPSLSNSLIFELE